jgi:hypothetical protein
MVRDVQKVTAGVIGAILTLLGLVGFVTAPMVLGFGVNAWLSAAHLITGLIGLAAVWQGFAKLYNRWGGVFYIVVAILGFVAAGFAGFLNANAATNLLHLVVGIILAGIGFVYKPAETKATA